MRSIFISHSSQDKEFVRRIAADLQARGLRVWLDEAEIKVGDSITDRISEAIKETDFVLVVLSEHSIKSNWVQKEVKLALTKEKESNRIYLLPVVIGKPEIPKFMEDKLYVDLNESYEKGIRAIVDTVVRHPTSKTENIGNVLDIENFAKEVAKEVADILRVSPKGIRIEDNPIGEFDPKLVFVIIAFTSDMEPIFEGIKAAGESFGLRVERVKDVQGDFRITDKVIEMINKAFLIVADLTHERPNVYFELGYARGLKKKVITTAREGTKVHFDVKDWTYTPYNDSRVLEKHLRSRFAFELGIND